MNKVAYRRGIRILIAGTAALALVILALGTLVAAAKPVQTNSGTNPHEPDLTASPVEANLSPVRWYREQQHMITSPSWVITLTPFTDPNLPPGQMPGDAFPTRETVGVPFTKAPSVPRLPGWVAEEMKSGGLQTADTDDLSIVKRVMTSLTTRVTDKSTVLNGEVIVYIITITNRITTTISDISLIDELPRDTLADVRSFGGDSWGIISETIQIPRPFQSGFLTIQFPRTVTAFVATLAPNESRQVIFTGTVVCQPDGATFNNRAAVIYKKNGEFQAGQSNEPETTVQIIPEANGDFSMSKSPTWCSLEPGGTYDLDWGDYDRDGDLDLALGSTAGIAVYRNEGGNLSRFWSNDLYTFATRWGDIDNDDKLELLTLSRIGEDFKQFTGHIYRLSEAGDRFVTDTLRSPFIQSPMPQLLRLALADYDRDPDGDLDLAIVQYNYPPCGLYFFKNDGTGNFSPDPQNSTCLVDERTRAIAWGDYNNDGYPDLAVGGFETNQVLINSSGTFGTSAGRTIVFDSSSNNFDISWGDYDRDGYLDLAGNRDAARIYHRNTSGEFDSPISKTTTGKMIGVDWGDFNGDDELELAVAHPQTKIYEYKSGDFSTVTILTRFINDPDNEIWRIRGADRDNDGDLDLIVGNRNGQSVLFTTFAPFLAPTLTAVEPPDPPSGSFSTMPASSVAWGDAVGGVEGGDGKLDLLFGAGPVGSGEESFLKSKLYENVDGNFPKANVTQLGFVGPHYVAFGDANGDGKLDIALATPNQNELYLNGNTASAAWRSTTSLNSESLAFADVDLDNQGRLDLLFGNVGPETLFLNVGLQLPTSAPDWSSTENDDTRSVAWGYLDDDLFPDFATGNYGQPNRVYRNNGGKSFTLVDWNPVFSDDPTRSVAWGDYDLDGDMDLAVGNYGRPNRIYENQGGILSNSPVWTAPVTSNTTSLAWGDWNNDGRPDLAVGNHGERDQVYANLRGPSGLPNLVWLWESAEAYDTTGVAWGDMDNDGDLDLAVSQDGDGQNGVYENTYVLAAHLKGDDFVKAMPLPQNPSYLSITPPGTPGRVFSSAHSITEATNLAIPFTLTVFDPDLSRQSCTGDNGEEVKVLKYEYSLDGGSHWDSATVASIPDTLDPYEPFPASCLGRERTVTWKAGQDLKNRPAQRVSDNTRFRVTIAHLNKTGPSQRASTSAVSPPFRVRNLSCTWPDNASIAVKTPIAAGVPTVFTGTVSEAQGQVVFNWDFGDHMTAQGQIVQHTYNNGSYAIRLSVLGPACPVAREAATIINVTVGTGVADIYLPLILKSSSGGRATGVTPEPPRPTPESGVILFAMDNPPGAPTQVSDLSGDARLDAGVTYLTWSPNPPKDGLLGYRVYRSQVESPAFRLLSELPAGVTNYTDDTAACGQMTFVTAYNAAGESLPSTASYFSPPCH
jgi:uncharacterized repeat protein (TIGR01451 family)